MPRLATPLSALAVLGASTALVACGGSSGSSSSSGSASAGTSTAAGGGGAGASNTADNQKFQQCLKDNGITLPGGGQGRPGGGQGYGGPGGGPGGGAGGNPNFRKAMQACGKYRPQGAGPGQGGGQGGGQNIQAFTPYLNCLKTAGLDIKVSDGFNALRNLKQSDPKVQAAFKSCQSKLPQRPNGGGNGQPSGTSTNGTT
jgi:hypothetical protein